MALLFQQNPLVVEALQYRSSDQADGIVAWLAKQGVTATALNHLLPKGVEARLQSIQVNIDGGGYEYIRKDMWVVCYGPGVSIMSDEEFRIKHTEVHR